MWNVMTSWELLEVATIYVQTTIEAQYGRSLPWNDTTRVLGEETGFK